MNMKKILLSLTLATGVLYQGAIAFAPTNFFRPYDSALRLPTWEKGTFKIEAQAEYASRSTGRNWKDKRCNILALHNDTESTLAMLKKSSNTEVQGLNDLVSTLIGMPVLDDNALGHLKTVGHQKLTADFNQWEINLAASYKLPIKVLPGTFELQAYVPFIRKEVHNVKIEDLTVVDTEKVVVGTEKEPEASIKVPLIDEVGKIIKEKVTANLKENVKKWGGIDFSDWDKTGLGDITFMLTWAHEFNQNKDYLKVVGLHGKVGFSVPTGEKKDEDIVVSMPLGFNGAWSIPFGLGLQLDFVNKIRFGIDAEFVATLDESCNRRMKKTEDQTEFLLLNKGDATKEYGLTWQFYLYLQGVDLVGGLSAKVAYQFVKHDGDRLVPKNNDFDYTVVNSANSLEEWNVHNLIFSLNYDAFKDFPTWIISPQLSVFYKLPVSGKNVIDSRTFGGQLAFRF